MLMPWAKPDMMLLIIRRFKGLEALINGMYIYQINQAPSFGEEA